MESMVRYTMRGFERDGLVRRYEWRQDINNDAYVLGCELRHGGRRQYRITGMEIMQGGPEAFMHWLDTVCMDIRARTQRERHGAMTTTEQRMRPVYQELYAREMAEIQRHISRQAERYFGTDLAETTEQTAAKQKAKQKATKRSEELFLLACGKEAFDTLQAGKPLPLTGSKGTAYTLHKRSTYCVERPSDNARLCAVVPGVPLWDHLLGIKLMIENDEPKFLATANVAMTEYASGQPWAALRSLYGTRVRHPHSIVNLGSFL